MIRVRRSEKRTEQGPYGSREVTTEVTERVPLIVPERWSMYTKGGNRRIKKFAEEAMAAVELHQKDKKKVKEILVRFLTRWELLGYTKAHGEAGDTAVRESVGNFHDRLAQASGHWDEFDVYDLWEKHRDAAWKKASEIRKRRAAKKALTPPPGGPSPT